ncbi:MAG TPA: hypothetical protein ENN66_05615 [Proteobacteria bacterium]|nr:hypothetical protein [Pseudomonadota bacterium]
MDLKKEWRILGLLVLSFMICYFLPVGWLRFDHAVLEALHLLKWYAREHVILCLVPAFFIAGAISVFVSQASVMKYLGAGANKILAYGVASVSGSILAVCSCTVLPLFSGIYRMGAGLGPATAFLYSGPAINILSIVLTARVLGPELGLARALGAVLFSVVIGTAMHFCFYREEQAKKLAAAAMPEVLPSRPLWQNALYFAALVAILVFANWAPPQQDGGIWALLYHFKWYLASVFSLFLGLILILWFKVFWWQIGLAILPVAGLAWAFPQNPIPAFTVGTLGLSVICATSSEENAAWLSSTWGFSKQIFPLLLIGVLAAGLLLGRVGHEGLIPSTWVSEAVGGNSLRANFLASFAGAFMYFATLTEVPILQGLIGSGMGKGPALALLLAGPALSLPNMLVIRGVLGTPKTLVFVSLVICMATTSGMLFGFFF